VFNYNKVLKYNFYLLYAVLKKIPHREVKDFFIPRQYGEKILVEIFGCIILTLGININFMSKFNSTI